MAQATAATSAGWSALKQRLTPIPRDLVLELAVRLAHRIPGNIIEFGVFDGQSTRVLRRTLSWCERDQIRGRRKRIFACDSFKGLPEAYETLPPGTFACEPPRIRGVEIVEGYFEDSLTPDLARRVGPVALASLDADLYASTLCALRWLTPLLHTGSLLLFDEFLGEGESEKRAFTDWSAETGIATMLVAEFLRDPSGHSGKQPDRRMLFQVIGADVLARRDVTTVSGQILALRGRLQLRTRAKRLLGRV